MRETHNRVKWNTYFEVGRRGRIVRTRALAGIHIINVWNVSEKTVLLFVKQKRPKKIGSQRGGRYRDY